MPPEDIFKSLYQKIGYEYFNESNKFEKDIIHDYEIALKILTDNYEDYRKYISSLLGTLEDHHERSLSYSLTIYFQLLNKLTDQKDLKGFDYKIIDQEYNDETPEVLFDLVKENVQKETNPRFADLDFSTGELTEVKKKEIASLIVDSVQENSKKLNWTLEEAEVILIQLAVLRNICVDLKIPEIFYDITGNFLDRLNTSQLFQKARDFSEEIIYSSFKDELKERGFFNSFRCYSLQTSVHSAILYANLSMYSVVNEGLPITDKYIKDLIWQSIKFFRDANLNKWAEKTYEEIPSHLDFTDYERRSIDCTYFTSLLAKKEEKLPNLLLDYLHKEREEILKGGIEEIGPWLVLLYNVKRIYKKADFTENGLGFYLSVFENFSSNTDLNHFKNIIEGDLESLKTHLKNAIFKLNQTRHISDLFYDNDKALFSASRITETSYSNKDVESFLLSMMVKSDFSLIFIPKESQEFSSFGDSENEKENIENIYNNIDKNAGLISQDDKSQYIWVAVTEGQLFQLSLYNKEFDFTYLKDWDWDKFQELNQSEYFNNLTFRETTKDHNGVRQISQEEYEEQMDNIISEINFGKLDIKKNADSIYLIKDMELASFPSNLFMMEDNFIHQKKAITNILSTEWYTSHKQKSELNESFTKSIWIPKKEGDLTINQLYSTLETILKENDFNEFTSANLKNPLSSDINIVCSHGSKDIANKQVLYPNNSPLFDHDNIIGNGQILIFFVCHSGSYKTEYLRNNINSIVKSYISAGYESVIAPFWSLHVNIPKIWLPTFLKSIKDRNPLDIALFEANQSLYKKYPTPSAFCDMHLYGNPHLKIT